MILKRFLATVTVAITLLAPSVHAQESPNPGPTGGTGGDTTAVAINTKDGSSIFKLAFSIRRVVGDVVNNSNAAVAWSSCESCRTVAIAIQIVLVFTEPAVVTPTNLAIAVNQDCTSCDTLASAYQWVLGTGGPVTFTQEGKEEIKAIRKELKALADADLTIAELQAALDTLMVRLDAVLRAELVPVGSTGSDDQASEDPAAQPSPSPEGPTPGPSPAEPSPSPSMP